MHSDLVNPRTRSRHGLPVPRLETVLHEIHLMACRPPGLLREGSDILEGRPEPIQRLLRHTQIYKFLYAAQPWPASMKRPLCAWVTNCGTSRGTAFWRGLATFRRRRKWRLLGGPGMRWRTLTARARLLSRTFSVRFRVGPLALRDRRAACGTPTGTSG